MKVLKIILVTIPLLTYGADHCYYTASCLKCGWKIEDKRDEKLYITFRTCAEGSNKKECFEEKMNISKNSFWQWVVTRDAFKRHCGKYEILK